MTLIAAMEPDARPRERLAARGAEQLTDGELLAVVLGTGRRGASALEVAAAVLRGVEGPAGLLRASPVELAGFAGIGPVRATLIAAALELGRRAVAGRPSRGQRVAGASEVWTYLRSRLAPLSVEEFWALGLDVRHRVQSEHCLARGSLTGVEIHPRDVFRPLIRQATAAVIFCHNHPVGRSGPLAGRHRADRAAARGGRSLRHSRCSITSSSAGTATPASRSAIGGSARRP